MTIGSPLLPGQVARTRSTCRTPGHSRVPVISIFSIVVLFRKVARMVVLGCKSGWRFLSYSLCGFKHFYDRWFTPTYSRGSIEAIVTRSARTRSTGSPRHTTTEGPAPLKQDQFRDALGLVEVHRDCGSPLIEG